MSWEQVTSLKALQRMSRTVYKKGMQQIAVVLVGETIFAIDNRCPHQGFPLEDGIVDNARLRITCNRHFWEFCLKTGKSLGGGGDLRTYPTKIERDFVWIEV